MKTNTFRILNFICFANANFERRVPVKGTYRQVVGRVQMGSKLHGKVIEGEKGIGGICGLLWICRARKRSLENSSIAVYWNRRSSGAVVQRQGTTFTFTWMRWPG